MLRKERAAARRLTRARILLLAEEDRLDQDTAAAVRCAVGTVERNRRRFVEGGVETALSDRPRPSGLPRLDARATAHLIALAYSTPPNGRPSGRCNSCRIAWSHPGWWSRCRTRRPADAEQGALKP